MGFATSQLESHLATSALTRALLREFYFGYRKNILRKVRLYLMVYIRGGGGAFTLKTRRKNAFAYFENRKTDPLLIATRFPLRIIEN